MLELPARGTTDHGNNYLAPLRIDRKKIIFFSIFSLAFLLSGLITLITLDILPYRMGLASLLAIPLLLIYGIKFDKVTIAFILLAALILLSGLINNTPIISILLFFRIPIFAYLIYRLVQVYISQDNITKVIKICVLIGLIQLPIIVSQQLIYERLPISIKNKIILIDFDFGTFNFKGDSAMGFFLIMLIAFLLFDTKRNYIIKYKWFVVLWFTLTILVANSELNKFIVLSIWGIFLLRYLNIRTIMLVIIVFTIIAGGLFASGMLNETIDEFVFSVVNNISIDERKQEAFLAGNYGRQSAIAYYLNQGVTWFGDGPGKYFDVLSKTRLRGNTGHIFTFYSELGLLGLLSSYFIFFLIAFPSKNGRMKADLMRIVILFSVIILSVTAQVMNDISIFLIYCIILSTLLIPPKRKEPQLNGGNILARSV